MNRPAAIRALELAERRIEQADKADSMGDRTGPADRDVLRALCISMRWLLEEEPPRRKHFFRR